MKKQCT